MKTEYYLRKQFVDALKNTSNHSVNISAQLLDTSVLIRHFYDVMTEQEKIKLKSLNILKSGIIHHRTNKNPLKKLLSIFPSNHVS